MRAKTPTRKAKSFKTSDALAAPRNVGTAMLQNFHLLGIETVAQLAKQDADALFGKLSAVLGERIDPCVHDVFSATIHQARTGETISWWHFSDARKQRQ